MKCQTESSVNKIYSCPVISPAKKIFLLHNSPNNNNFIQIEETVNKRSFELLQSFFYKVYNKQAVTEKKDTEKSSTVFAWRDGGILLLSIKKSN